MHLAENVHKDNLVRAEQRLRDDQAAVRVVEAAARVADAVRVALRQTEELRDDRRSKVHKRAALRMRWHPARENMIGFNAKHANMTQRSRASVRTFSGCSRASMHDTIASFLAGGIGSAPAVKEAA